MASACSRTAYVYPACAGIDPVRRCTYIRGLGLPRMRGDRPQTEWIEEDCGEFTPHARGSTMPQLSTFMRVYVYPACAGIDLSVGAPAL